MSRATALDALREDLATLGLIRDVHWHSIGYYGQGDIIKLLGRHAEPAAARQVADDLAALGWKTQARAGAHTVVHVTFAELKQIWPHRRRPVTPAAKARRS